MKREIHANEELSDFMDVQKIKCNIKQKNDDVVLLRKRRVIIGSLVLV